MPLHAEAYLFAEHCLRLGNQMLVTEGRSISLAPKVYAFLKYLCEAKINNGILEKERLAELVWQGRFVSDEAIARVVATARKSLCEDSSNDSIIETVRKRGYRLKSEVTIIKEGIASIPLPHETTTIDQLNKQAEQAIQDARFEKAIELYVQALDKANSTTEKAEQELRLIQAQMASGTLPNSKSRLIEIARFARRQNLWSLLATTAVTFNLKQEDARPDELVIKLLKWAIESMPENPCRLGVRVLARYAESLYTSEDLKRAQYFSNLALEKARELNDPKALAVALHCQCYATYAPGQGVSRTALIQELHEVAVQQDDDSLIHNAYIHSAANALEAGNRQALDQTVADYQQHVDRTQIGLFKTHLGYLQALQHLLDGRLDLAEKKAQAYFQDAIILGHAIVGSSFAIQIYGIKLAQGQLHDIRDIMSEMARNYPLTPWGLAHAYFEVQLGRFDLGEHWLSRFFESQSTALQPDINYLTKLAFLAQLAIAMEDREKMLWVYDLLKPYSSSQVTVGIGILTLGSVDFFLGIIKLNMGQYSSARSHLQMAQQQDLKLANFVALAQTRLYLAKAIILDNGDKNQAKSILLKALKSSDTIGMKEIARLIREELKNYPNQNNNLHPNISHVLHKVC